MSRAKLEQGNNSVTRIEGDRVFKSRKGLGLERVYSEQAKQWNAYYADTEYASACVTEKGELSLPYISGDYPANCQLLACLQEMHDRKFVMVDCRDKRNFIAHNGKVYPVDFGQIYTETDKFYSTYEKLHLAEIEKLPAKIRSEKAVSPAKFISLEQHLKELRLYKEKKLTSTDQATQNKAGKIDGFIADTKTRLEAFKGGCQNAFSDYIEKNQDAIKVLNENRVTGAIWKSILLVLCTGIVPGLLGGIVQAAVTKGNSFLFFNNQTKSGQMAADIQKDVASLSA